MRSLDGIESVFPVLAHNVEYGVGKLEAESRPLSFQRVEMIVHAFMSVSELLF